MIIDVRETMRMRFYERIFFMLLQFFGYAKQTFKSFGQIDYIILLTI